MRVKAGRRRDVREETIEKGKMLKQSGKKFQEFARFGKSEELQFDEGKKDETPR